MILWILIASFSVIILGLIIINTKVNGGFKIEASWIAIALAPAVIWLLATGQLSGFTGFGIEFKLKEASAKPFSLSLEGDKIKPAFVSLGEKGGIGNIPELIRNRVAALALQLNRRNYYANWAIRQYLEELTQHDFFRYVVFIGTDGEFRGITQPDHLLNQMRNLLLLLFSMTQRYPHCQNKSRDRALLNQLQWLYLVEDLLV